MNGQAQAALINLAGSIVDRLVSTTVATIHDRQRAIAEVVAELHTVTDPTAGAATLDAIKAAHRRLDHDDDGS